MNKLIAEKRNAPTEIRDLRFTFLSNKQILSFNKQSEEPILKGVLIIFCVLVCQYTIILKKGFMQSNTASKLLIQLLRLEKLANAKNYLNDDIN